MMNSVGGHGYDGLTGGTTVDGGGMLGGHPNGVGTTHPDDLAMMDDLERAKHYKSNIIQDFNDRQSMYSSRVGGGFGGNAYNKSRYDDGLYSDSKSMYGGYGGQGADGTAGKMYSHDAAGGGGSKSVYGGYSASNTGSNAAVGNNLRRSRSIHAKLPPRRDPYDYLPDEPQTQLLNEQNAAGVGAGATGTGTGAMVGNKPDIMQSVGMDGTGR